jgi:two-component system, OmpR family, alkaline phosphatase synthesis response regulator PhoP
MVRVLVVDDDPVILHLIVLNLELEGHEAVTAMSGMQALELARSEQPDVLVLDVMLPGMDGFEVCRTLQHDRSTERIPVVLLSARALHSDVQRGLEAGAVEYVTKPFDPLDLVAIIERHAARAP